MESVQCPMDTTGWLYVGGAVKRITRALITVIRSQRLKDLATWVTCCLSILNVFKLFKSSNKLFSKRYAFPDYDKAHAYWKDNLSNRNVLKNEYKKLYEIMFQS